MFRRLYAWMVHTAAHPKAPWWLTALAFAESSFFPIPPDVMLAPMTLASRARAWRYAMLATVGSTLGALFGYVVGLLFIEQLLPWLHQLGYYQGYEVTQQWFARYGFWAVLIAAFSPVPYKLFTISAGALSMLLLPFVLASIVGRGARFFLVAGLACWLGPAFEQSLLKYLDWIGWTLVAVLGLVFVVYRLL